MPHLKIGELSTRVNCPVETIRYYEREGLLPAVVRSEGNYRLYGEAHVDQLRFIRNCRSLDMTLQEIRALLRFRDSPGEDCGEVNALLDDHVGHVAKRIDELKSLQKQLKKLRSLCRTAQAAKDCKILHGLSVDGSGSPASLGSHGRSRH